MIKKLTLSILILALILGLGLVASAKWENKTEVDPECYIQRMQFINETKGVAVGTGGAFFNSNDGGNKWTKTIIPEVKDGEVYTDLYDVHFVDEKNGWIVGKLLKGAGVILYTRDGGKVWDRQNSGTSIDLYYVYFRDTKNGFAVGANGTILVTQNSGGKWTAISGGQASSAVGEGNPGYWCIKFVTPQKGWIVGESGAIRMTADGGKTWVEQKSGTDSNLNAVEFVNENVGWAVGEGAAIINTTDGGKTWTAQKPGLTEEWFYGVDFINENEGLVVGDYGTILRTTDGGKTWIVERTAKQKGVENIAFYAVSFLKPDLAFAAGQFGEIYKYVK